MKMARWVCSFLLMLGAAWGWIQCGGEIKTDGGVEDDTGTNKCQIDSSQRNSTSTNRSACQQDEDCPGGTVCEEDSKCSTWELKPGGAARKGALCPKGDVDYFWFRIDTPGTIVRVKLNNSVAMSPVDYCVSITSQGPPIAAIGTLCDHDGMNGVTNLLGTFYIATAGVYFLEIQDEGGNDQDARPEALYQVSIETVLDPDTHEPNNTYSQAKTVQATEPLGYISFLGDEDWFKKEVSGTGQMLTIDVTTTAATPVDLRYAVYKSDGISVVNVGENPDGMKGPTVLHDVLALAEAGTYYIQITDALNDDSDVTVGYRLQVSVQDDPDARDRGARNDSFDRATPITSGVSVTQAYFATRADADWYVIDAPGVTDVSPALLEIDLSISSDSPVDPAIDLIVADPNTPCQAGNPCDELTSACGTGGDCESVACRDARCPSHECITPSSKCRGAGVCLTGGCGIRSLVMHGLDWSEVGDLHHLHTVAPMYGSRYYFMVRDYQGDDLDPTRPYTFSARVIAEPDTHESPPNGLYLPYATEEQDHDSRPWNAALAAPIACQVIGVPPNDHFQCGPIQGNLSFRGDQDWYKLEGIPTEDETVPDQDSTKVDYKFTFTYSYGGAKGLYINYALYLGDSLREGQMGWNYNGNTGGNRTFGGDQECAYLCGEYHQERPLYFSVQHSDRKKYDYAAPYSVTLIVERQCPQVCEYCQAGQTWAQHACPNPINPYPIRPE
jgi:hypothetical protein